MKPKIKALLDQIKSGKLKSDKLKILNFIQNNPFCTIRDIEAQLNIIHETASARVSDLMDLGVVEAKETGNYSEFFYQPDSQTQKINAFLRKEEKFKRWKNKAKQFSDILNEDQLNFIDYLNPDLKQKAVQ